MKKTLFLNLFCRFCIALAAPQRKRRLPQTFTRLSSEHHLIRGEILAFIHIQEKTWTLWFDIVPSGAIDSCISDRLQQGFHPIRKIETTIIKDEKETFSSRRGGRKDRFKTTTTEEKKVRTDLDISDTTVYELVISGDINIMSDDPSYGNMDVHFCSLLRDSYRKFSVQPDELDESRDVVSEIKCFLVNQSTKERTLVRSYELTATKAEVEAFRYVEPEVEPEPENTLDEKIDIVIPDNHIKRPPVQPKTKRSNPAAFARLTQLNKAPRKSK